MKRQHRGAAAVAMVLVLIMVNLIVIRVVISGGRDHDLTVRRVETIRAFYAAEAGMNMAIKELMDETDHDGDTVTGTISDDTNDGTDPTLTGSAFVVTSATAGSQTTLTSTGRSGDARREMDAVLE